MNIATAGKPQPLPQYRALLVVDIKDFSGRKGTQHAQLTEAVPEILRSAFERAGIVELWDEHRFGATTGDGYAAGFRADVLPFLLNPLLMSLQEELAYRNTVDWVAGHEQPLRMRVSVNVGPMTDSGLGQLGDGSGRSRIENHRLLDSAPVRDLLTRSGPPTCVAAIVSERAFEDAVMSGYAAEDEQLYVPVAVRVKTYKGTAYLRVPKPSGDLLRRGFKIESSGSESATGPGSLPGDRAVTTSTVVHNARGPMNTGPGHQFNGDKVNYVERNEGNVQQSLSERRKRADDRG